MAWKTLGPVCAVLLWLAPARAQEMTKAQEEAYTTLYDLSVAAAGRRDAGDFAGAEALHRQSLDIVRDVLGGSPLSMATSLHALADAVALQGRLEEAEALQRQALDLRLANGGVPEAVAAAEEQLALILDALGRADEAAALQASAASRLAGAASPADLALLAIDAAEAGDFDRALVLLAEVEAGMAKMTPAEAARSYNALGRVQSLAGRPDLAEAAYREALRRAQALAGDPDWTAGDRATVLNNLGAILAGQGRADEALPLFRQALEGGDPASDPLGTAVVLEGVAGSLRAAGDYQGAYDASRMGLELRMAALPEGHPLLAASFTSLGDTLLRAGQAEVATQSLQKALAIAQGAGDSLRTGRAAMMLATAEAAQGRPAFDMALWAQEVLAEALPPGDPQAAQARFNAAWLGLAEGRAAEAMPVARAAMAEYATRAGRIGVDATIAASGDAGMRRQVLAVTAAAWDLDRTAMLDEAFQAAQWAMASSAGRSTQRMAARLAVGEGALAALIRDKQDLVNRWQAQDRAWLADFDAGQAAEATDTGGIETQIAAIDARIARDFPDYATLTAPRVLSLAEVQALLAADESLLVVVPTPDETYVFAIAATSALWHRAPVTAEALSDAVRHLRADLDPTGPARSAAALTAPAAPQGPSFDRAAAHDLYRALIEPVAQAMPPGGRVLVVADGALSSLPLAVLVREAPSGDDGDPAALMATAWLAASHAFATLPAVSSLAALRDRPASPAPVTGLAGFGDPDFAGEGQVVALAGMFDGPLARSGAVRALPRLPGTRRELEGLARSLNARDDALRLGAQATETAVRSADLSGAGLVVFATHGLVAGDISGLAEPALALSPPAVAGPLDDGLLTASEAAELRLNAAWVILSACNTAAGDGTPGAEGLSGLASAFLYAGARGLLVSHWPVGDTAAERLTQDAVARLAADPGAGQAAALAGAMATLRADPAFAHPAAWAPFVVVGDGR